MEEDAVKLLFSREASLIKSNSYSHPVDGEGK